MKVSEALAQIGVNPEMVPGDLCIVRFDENKRPLHYRLDEVGSAEITSDVYLASGTFASGAISRHKGRSQENVVRVMWLAIDCDFSDYIGCTKESLFDWPDGDLMTAAHALNTDLKEIMDMLGVPLHRVDYTGYGICGYVYLGDHAQSDIPTIDAIYKELIARINGIWSDTLTDVRPRKIADTSVADAGSRFNRLVPCPNTKGSIKRFGSTLWFNEGRAEIADLDATIERRTRTNVARAILRTGSQLDAATIDEFAAALRAHWHEGSRHAIALYAAGIFAKAGIAQDQTNQIITRAAGDDPEMADRIRAVETSYARARAGLETRGLYGLRDWLPIETVEWIDRRLEEVRPRVAETTFTVREGTPTEPLRSVPSDELHVLPIPESARQGLIGEYISLMEPVTEASESYHLAVALTISSAMIGRSVYVNYGTRMYSNLFTLLVGESGDARKDTTIKLGIGVLHTVIPRANYSQVNSGVRVVTDISSAEGLISSLSQHPNILLYLTEFARMMGNANRKGTGTITPVLMEAFDNPDVLSNLSKLNPVEAKAPYATLLSATQPRILDALISEDHVHSGFLNRWLIVAGKGKDAIPWPRTSDAAAIALLFEQMQVAIHGGGTVASRGMDVSPTAMPFWEEWYRQRWEERKTLTSDEKAMSTRHPDMAVKIALIYAVLNGDQVIGEEHLRVSTEIVEWAWKQLRPMLPGWGSSPLAKLEQRVLSVLTERGAMKRKTITTLCSNPRRWTTQDIKRTVDALLDNGLIRLDSQGVIGLAE